MRYERTMTKRDRSHSPRSNFDQIKDDEAENMAQNIENKFKEQTPKEVKCLRTLFICRGQLSILSELPGTMTYLKAKQHCVFEEYQLISFTCC